MNCQEFQTLANDLACEKVIEASQYKLALAHKNSCAPCAARLVNERALTRALQLTASAETGQASAHTKAALLKAFAEHTGISPAPRASATNETIDSASGSTQIHTQPHNVLPFQSRKPGSTYVSRWLWIAAAAAIIALLTVGALSLLQSARNKQPENAKQQPSIDSPKSNSGEQNPTATVPLPENPPQDQKPIADNQPAVQPHNRIPTSQNRMVARATKRQVKTPGTSNEVTTDYIPLTYASNATAIESGHVVRMMVSRSTLISMGLPMNVERDREMVKADVVVGDDGLARAIRFVYSKTQINND